MKLTARHPNWCGINTGHDCLGAYSVGDGEKGCVNGRVKNAARPKNEDGTYVFNNTNKALKKAATDLYGNHRIKESAHSRYVAKDFTSEEQVEIVKKAGVISVVAALDKEETEVSAAIDSIVAQRGAFNADPIMVTAITALKEKRERINQAKFRNQVLYEDAQRCIFTGDTMVTASHLNVPRASYSKYGLTMRMDLAHWWDYYNTKALHVEGGEIIFHRPGHEVHGKVAKLSNEKKAAVIAELLTMEGRV